MAQAGTVLGGRYVLDDQIGNGGYGEVWRATDTVLARPVAVKLLYPRYTQRSEALARFRAEARHAGGLSHENIAQVFDYGEPADGQPPYLVMELVDGPSLETVLTGGPLDDTRTMDIVAQAAVGLQAAHAAGMIHRDIKPGNLLLAPGGAVKITDFGGLQPTIVLSAHPEPTPGKLRLHFDVSPVGCDQDAELARLMAAGARPADVGQRGDEGWHVLADPEGNEFCLLRRQPET